MTNYAAQYKDDRWRKRRYNAESSDLILEAIYGRHHFENHATPTVEIPPIGPSETECYARAITRIKDNEVDHWEGPQGKLLTKMQKDGNHPLHHQLTSKYKHYFLKGGPWPGQMIQFIAVMSGDAKLKQGVLQNKDFWGFINGADNIYLTSQHGAYEAHKPYQQALATKGQQMMQEWTTAEEPGSWLLPEKYRLVFDAIQVCIDGTIPSRAPAMSTTNGSLTYAGGAQYLFFTFWHRSGGAEGWEDCWGWRGGWCDNVENLPSEILTDSPLLQSYFIKKWPLFAQAVNAAQAAADLGIITRKGYIDKIVKKINASINTIKHAPPNKSEAFYEINDKTIFPRMGDVGEYQWYTSSPSPAALIDKDTVNRTLLKETGIPLKDAANPLNMFWGSPHKVVYTWKNGYPMFRATYLNKSWVNLNWKTRFDEWAERKPFGPDGGGDNDSWYRWSYESGGVLCFNFLRGIEGSSVTSTKSHYKIYDYSLEDSKATDGLFLDSFSGGESRFSVGLDDEDIKTMIIEWFNKNPDGKLYLKGVEYTTPAALTGQLAAVREKFKNHFKKNKTQWEQNYFNPPAPGGLDHTRFDLTDNAGWGKVVDESYDEGLVKWFQTYDAYRNGVQQFSIGDTDARKLKAQQHEEAWSFASYDWGDKSIPRLQDRLMRKQDKIYDSNTHYFDANDTDKHKEFKDKIEKIFVDQTALAICAWYVGSAKMEYQEGFLIEILKKKDKEDKKLDQAALDEARRDADQDLRENNITSANQTPGAGALTDEEIEKRQKFFKQCALMLNMEQFVEAHRFRVNAEIANRNATGIHSNGNGPYDGRFWMLEDSGQGADKVPDQSSIVNKLFISNNLYAFMNIPQAIVAMLVPKIRIYQVFSNGSGALEECEFEFQQEGLSFPDTNGLTTVADRIENLMSVEFDKGAGAGIKSFSWVYEGTTPATARNDISCDLSLYFQSFDDFFKSRQNSISKKEYAFVDMVLYPDNRRKKKTNAGTESFRKRDYDVGTKQEYDPSDYRIRADVGWNIPSEASRDKINQIAAKQGLHYPFANGQHENSPDYYDQLKDIINASNKSFYLTMVDHKMDIKDTGAVQIDINYRAYVETALKTNRFNALLDRETFLLKKTQKAMLIEAKERQCTRQDLIKLRREIDRQNELITKNAHQSIMRRLIMRNKIFYIDVDEVQKAEYERIGYFSKRPRYVNYKKAASSELATATSDTKARLKAASKKSNINSASFKLTRDKWVDENVSKNIRVNYFFMGDLIYTILDVINDTELEPDLEKTKLLLGSFEYVDYDGRTRIANIADIPVSCDYFFEWYTQHVVKAKRQSFPIAYFVRTLCNHFITELLSDKCRNKSQVMKISFKTGTFMAAPHTATVGSGANTTSLTRDPFYWMTTSGPTSASKTGDYPGLDRLMVQVGKYYDGTYNNNEMSLPLTHYDVTPSVGDESTSQRFFQYMLVYPVVSPAMNHPGTGDELVDRKRGVHHIHIGGRTGVIKKVSFDRTDIQYIRESRFLNQGSDGLLQLGAVYKATIDMIGNTLWFPGMELYINPLGIGGLELGFPNDSSSKANKLGLGGYHLITRIKSNIAPGVYNTQVEAQFFYSGDGSIDKQRLGLASKEETPSITADDTVSEQCQSIMDRLVAGTAHLGGKLSRIDSESSYSERKHRETQNAKTINDKAKLPPFPTIKAPPPSVKGAVPGVSSAKRLATATRTGKAYGQTQNLSSMAAGFNDPCKGYEMLRDRKPTTWTTAEYNKALLELSEACKKTKEV